MGVDYRGKLTLLEETEKYLIVQVGGGVSFYGRGTQKYYLPTFRMFIKKNGKIVDVLSVVYDREHKKEVWDVFIKEVEKVKKIIL